MKNLPRMAVKVAVVLVLVFVAAVIVELAPPLQRLDQWMLTTETFLLVGNIAVIAIGLLLLIGSVVSLLMDSGTPMDHADIENQARSMRDAEAGPRAFRASSYRLCGKGAGSQGHDEFSFAQLKAAYSGGTLLRTPVWRRRLVAMIGAMAMFIGIVGLVLVISPMALKLLVAGVFLYAVIRMAVGLWQA